MNAVIVFGPDKEEPLDDELDMPEADIKDKIALPSGEFESILSGEFDNQLGVNLIRNQNLKKINVPFLKFIKCCFFDIRIIFSLYAVTLSFSEPNLRTRVEKNERRKIKSAKTYFFRKTFQHFQKYFTNNFQSLKRKSSSAPVLNFEVNSKSGENYSPISKNDSFREMFISSVDLTKIKGDGSSQSSNESEISEAVEVTENEKCYGNNKNNTLSDTSVPLCSEKMIKKKLSHERTVKQFVSNLLCSSFNGWDE